MKKDFEELINNWKGSDGEKQATEVRLKKSGSIASEEYEKQFGVEIKKKEGEIKIGGFKRSA